MPRIEELFGWVELSLLHVKPGEQCVLPCGCRAEVGRVDDAGGRMSIKIVQRSNECAITHHSNLYDIRIKVHVDPNSCYKQWRAAFSKKVKKRATKTNDTSGPKAT